MFYYSYTTLEITTDKERICLPIKIRGGEPVHRHFWGECPFNPKPLAMVN